MSSKRQSHGIDWAGIRRAIRKAGESTTAALNPDQRQMEEILQARAARLAMPEQTAVPEDQCDLTLFTINASRLAIATHYVRGVTKAAGIARLHGGPAHLLGVCNYQGDVVAVVDGGMTYWQEAVIQHEDSLLLVLGKDQVELAVLVSAIDGQMQLPESRIDTSSLDRAANAADVMKGVITGLPEGDVLSVIDGALLLRDPRLYFDI